MFKTLFIISHLAGGGAERALANITLNWPSDCEIDILCNNISGKEYNHRGKIISLDIDDGKISSIAFQTKLLLRRIKVLRVLKKSNNYAMCISFMDSANIANIISGKKHCKTIVSVRQSLQAASNKYWYYKWVVSPLAKLFYDKANFAVTVSEELKDELENCFNLNNVVAIPNGYDVRTILEQSEQHLTSEDKRIIEENKVIFTAGRLTQQKNQWHLIRAMSEVVKAVPNAKLIIAGEGELQEYLQKLIDELDLRDNINLIGFQSNVYKWERIADVYVMPSGWEGFPNALAEAMCVGCPVVVSDFKTGAREIVSPSRLGDGKPIDSVTECEYGIMCKLCSSNKHSSAEPLEEAEIQLADAIVRLLTDDELNQHYRNQSKLRAQSLGIDEAVKKWVSLVES